MPNSPKHTSYHDNIEKSNNNITTSPIHDIENQFRMSPYRELRIDSSPVHDIENQLQIPLIRPKAGKPKSSNQKKVNIEELYNVNKSFYQDSPPSHLLTPHKKNSTNYVKPITKVHTNTDLLNLETKSNRAFSPLSWAEYKRTHLSPDNSTINDLSNGYFPGGFTRKKKKNPKRKISKRKTNKKRKRNVRRKSCKK